MSATDKAVELVQQELGEKEAELESVAGPLAAEVKTLQAWIKKNTRGSSKAANGPKVSDEDLLVAVGHASKNGPAKSTDIAKVLDVDPRSIARTLSAWAKDDESPVNGDKDSGYTVG